MGVVAIAKEEDRFKSSNHSHYHFEQRTQIKFNSSQTFLNWNVVGVINFHILIKNLIMKNVTIPIGIIVILK
jgi:hypothetical protein